LNDERISHAVGSDDGKAISVMAVIVEATPYFPVEPVDACQSVLVNLIIRSTRIADLAFYATLA